MLLIFFTAGTHLLCCVVTVCRATDGVDGSNWDNWASFSLNSAKCAGTWDALEIQILSVSKTEMLKYYMYVVPWCSLHGFSSLWTVSVCHGYSESLSTTLIFRFTLNKNKQKLCLEKISGHKSILQHVLIPWPGAYCHQVEWFLVL